MTDELPYDVALSFAGEDRRIAEELANALRSAGLSVFYDLFSRAELWGKDLYQHLQIVYKDRAKLCVILTSKYYAEKSWTKHELKQAQARAFISDTEYILPIRLDDTPIPGLNDTVGYLDMRTTTVAQVATILSEKLGVPTDEFDVTTDRERWDGSFVEYNGHQVASYWPKQIERAQHAAHYLVTTVADRIQFGDERRFGEPFGPEYPCGDCGVLYKQFHVPGCDLEECPHCGQQAISCECSLGVITAAERDAWLNGDGD